MSIYISIYICVYIYILYIYLSVCLPIQTKKELIVTNSKESSFLDIKQYFFFILSFWACVLDHRIM